MKLLFALLLGTLMCLGMSGCPHRSPVWSPDSKHLLLLALQGSEEVDRPAGGIWLVEPETRKASRLGDPLPRALYLAAGWLDNRAYYVLAAQDGDGEVKEGSEGIWRGEVGSEKWTRIPGPPPSSERSNRRNPVAIQVGGKAALVYTTGPESVVVVEVAGGKELLRIQTAELVGPGPRGGFLIARPDAEASGLEVVAIGSNLKTLWSKRFSELSSRIAARLGKKPMDIVINDTSTSELVGSPPGSEVGLVLVYTDVSWRDGISGYYVRFSETGDLLSANAGMALPGRPRNGAGAVWAVAPARESGGGDRAAVRSFPLKGGEGERLEIPGVKRNQIHGYSMSPSGRELGVVVGGRGVKLLLYQIDGGKVRGGPEEIEIKA